MSSLLNSASRDELQQILKILKNYRGAYRQIGKRAVLMDPRMAPEKTLRVQCAEDDISEMKKIIETLQLRYFPEARDVPMHVEFDPQLIGGVRIFYADDMVDISFEGFVQKIQ